MRQEKDKMAKQETSKKGTGKNNSIQQSIPNDFKKLCEDYFYAREIQRGFEEKGSDVFDQPEVYDAVIARAANHLSQIKYASAANRLQGMSQGNDSLPKDHLIAFSKAWYSGSRNLLEKFCLESGNLETLVAQAQEDKIKNAIPQYSPPENAQGHEELAKLHGSYLRSYALLRQYQNAETRKDEMESALAIRAEAQAAVAEDVASTKDENAKAYLMAFARIVGRNSAVAESVMNILVKKRAEAFNSMLSSYKDARGYFKKIIEGMKTRIKKSDEVFDALYQVLP